MGLNKAFDRNFFLIDGAVKTTGGSLNLVKGQLAAIDQASATVDGLKVLSTFAGKAKDKKDFTLRLGIEGKTPGRSYSDKSYSTVPFSLNEVVELSVSAPKITEHIVDEVVIGYDGTPGSEFSFNTGDSYFRISLSLRGGAIDFRGGRDGWEQVGVNIEIPACDPFDNCTDPGCTNCDAVDCKLIVVEAVERLRRKQLTGGKTVADFIDITAVTECDTDLTAALIQYDFYTLSICDTGDDSAKAIVGAQYNTAVKRISRNGSTSVYQLLLPTTSGAPADFSSSIASIIKGCDTCPAGYTAVSGGYVYAFTIEDDGVDKSALITAMATYATGTVVKSGNSAGVGFYTAVFTAKITDAAITTLLGGAVPSNTFTVQLVGKVSDICTNSTTTDTAWVIGDSVNAVSEGYELWVPDDSCGNDRLVELQASYSNLTIALAQTRAVTLTGTSGTANITVAGTAYLVTFATSLTQTAANFVTTHAAALLLNKGLVVTAASGVITFANVSGAFPTVTAAVNATGDLAGTLGALTPVTAGCQHKYITSVISNLIGDECDDIYKDAYITVAPEAFEQLDWVAISNDSTIVSSGNCKCGIRFKSRVFVLDGDEALRDVVGFTETSTQIQVSAGFPEEIREGIGMIPEGGFQGKYLSDNNTEHI
jgi:hypothetical protein